MTSTSATPTAARSRGVHITLLVLQVLLALFFVFAAAIPKFAGQGFMVQMFSDIGVGQWLRYVVGGLELAGGIGLLIPRLYGLAAICLAGLMAGAGFTQAVVLGDPGQVVLPAILVVLLVVVAWGRWPQTRALIRR
jgi:putative oxidoreductase